MKSTIYISLLFIATLLFGCSDYEIPTPTTEQTFEVVKLLDDGQMLVSGRLSEDEMGKISVSSRAAAADKAILTGWCIIFGEDVNEQADTDSETYTKSSPLLLRKELTISIDGTFFVTLPRYREVAFIRVAVNLTPRETQSIINSTAWGDDENNYEKIGDEIWLKSLTTQSDMDGVTKFNDYIHQSVGLDGIYTVGNDPDWYSTEVEEDQYATDEGGVESFVYYNHNTISPDPNTDVADSFTMSSVGFALKDGITEESLKKIFGTTIYMVRVCSCVDVTVSDKDFKLSEVYMIDCPQESRLRSTVLSESADSDTSVHEDSFKNIPRNLGGVIDYKPLIENVSAGGKTSRIYFYPNSGNDYDSNGGAVDQYANPQYIIIKGRAAKYDTDGYYKIALKAQYPLIHYADPDAKDDRTQWSNLTYNILRNTHFNVDLTTMDKPGYKTLADAKNINNPANNVSYSITVESGDSRNEIVGSNGTFFAELHTSRVYMKGYEDTGASGSVSFDITPGAPGDYTPATYVMGDNGVHIDEVFQDGVNVPVTNSDDFEDEGNDTIHDYWFKAGAKGTKTTIKVNYTAKEDGRIRLRIGDMLKYIPVIYESENLSYKGGALSFTPNDGSFAYESDSELVIWDTYQNLLTPYGTISSNKNKFTTREMQARIYPSDSSGVADLYLKQSSDLVMRNPDNLIEAQDIDLVYNSKGEIHQNNGATPINGNNFSYEIKGAAGDVTLDFTDKFKDDPSKKEFSAFSQTGKIALNNKFSFLVKSIDTNNGNGKLESDVTFDLKNKAGDKKKYSIKITQYAAPSADLPTETGKDYIVPEPLPEYKVDYLNYYRTGSFIGLGGSAVDKGKVLETITIYNCKYTGSPVATDGEFGWMWEEVPEEIRKEGDGTATEQKNRVDEAINVAHTAVDVDSNGYGTYTFRPTMKNGGTFTTYKLASAYFVLIVENEIGEKCKTKLLLQCKSEN